MSVLVGPVGHAGHPFALQTEYIARRWFGDHLVYSFGETWPDSEIGFVPEDEVTHIILWDPAWLRGEPVIEMFDRLREENDVQIVGVYSDWFAGWYGGEAARRSGTRRSLDLCDRVLIDRYGAAALKRWGYPGEIRVLDQYLTYGRLLTRGADDDLVARTPQDYPQAKRDLDVVFVGNDHPGYVWNRPWLLDHLEAICQANGITCVIGHEYTARELEDLLLRAKIAFNTQLGTQPNMRCYEAAACGALLVTNPPTVPGSYRYETPYQIERVLQAMLGAPAGRQLEVERQTRWVLDHTPNRTWQRIIDAACD